MDEGRGLQRVAWTFSSQVTGGELAEFPVDERCQLIEGLLVTLRPFGQQQRYFVSILHLSRVEKNGPWQCPDYTPRCTHFGFLPPGRQ
jgi:hypothetical protein